MLFDTPERIVLDDRSTQSRARYVPRFLDKMEADLLLASLLRDSYFESERPIVHGKVYDLKRRSCAYGDPGVRYSYSGVTRQAAPWPAELRELASRLERFVFSTGPVYSQNVLNFVLCSLYPNGAAGLGWHADDEIDIVPGSAIASVSLGAERDFDFRVGHSGPKTGRVSLEHGSLLMMGGDMQSHYQHQIPKRAHCGLRVNLTFRHVRSSQ